MDNGQRHSVRRHLRINAAAYDAAIPTFIPGYAAMLSAAAREVARADAEFVLDIGAGTGALTEAILLAVAKATVELVDQDKEMLLQARVRLSRFLDRVRFTEASFFDPLPRCGAIAASLSLHHVPTMAAKRALYRGIHDALKPGGVFVNADAAVSTVPAARRSAMAAWMDHMAAHGIDAQSASDHFAAWEQEDTYFSLVEELEAVTAAGFDAECVWRHGPMAVVVGWKV